MALTIEGLLLEKTETCEQTQCAEVLKRLQTILFDRKTSSKDGTPPANASSSFPVFLKYTRKMHKCLKMLDFVRLMAVQAQFLRKIRGKSLCFAEFVELSKTCSDPQILLIVLKAGRVSDIDLAAATDIVGMSVAEIISALVDSRDINRITEEIKKKEHTTEPEQSLILMLGLCTPQLSHNICTKIVIQAEKEEINILLVLQALFVLGGKVDPESAAHIETAAGREDLVIRVLHPVTVEIRIDRDRFLEENLEKVKLYGTLIRFQQRVIDETDRSLVPWISWS